MIVKNGFLLIELMISFTLVFFLIFILTHYIIEIKNIQQEAFMRVELLSIARNITEKSIAFKEIKKLPALNHNDYIIKMQDKQISVNNKYKWCKNKAFNNVKNIIVEKLRNNYNRSICLSAYMPPQLH